MKENNHILYITIAASLMLHLSVFYSISWDKSISKKNVQCQTALVAVNIQPPQKASEKVVVDLPEPPPKTKPLPMPKPVQKPKVKTSLTPKRIKKMPQNIYKKFEAVKPALKKALPPSNKPASKNSPADSGNVKPVFGLNRDSMSRSGESSIVMRTGNTLMQEQEEEFTHPEEVIKYTSVPVIELSTLPVYKHTVDPVYPPSLKEKEIEGKVLLAATIDENGKVVNIKVKRSDNELFSQAAIAALKQSSFAPGEQNGKPVTTTIDIPIAFILDE
jgi:TonB family protein